MDNKVMVVGMLLFLSGCANYDDHIKKGDKLQADKNFSGAVAEYTKAAKLDSTKSLAYIKVVDIDLQTNKTEEAWTLIKDLSNVELDPYRVTVLNKKIEADPQNISNYKLLGEYYDKHNEMPKAIEVLQKALSVSNGNEQLRMLLGQFYLKAGSIDAGIGELQKIQKNSISFSEAQTLIGKAIDQNGYKGAKWGDTIDGVRKALKTSLSSASMGSDTGSKSPVTEWSLKQALYDYWGVPRSSFMGIVGYDDAHVPAKFKVYETKNGDYCVFYGGKFFAYYSSMAAKNYSDYVSKLSEKYGASRSYSVEFPFPTDQSQIYRYELTSWQNGNTDVLLIKEEMEAMGMRMTSVRGFNLSHKLLSELKDSIGASVQKARNLASRMNEKQKKEDIDKL